MINLIEDFKSIIINLMMYGKCNIDIYVFNKNEDNLESELKTTTTKRCRFLYILWRILRNFNFLLRFCKMKWMKRIIKIYNTIQLKIDKENLLLVFNFNHNGTINKSTFNKLKKKKEKICWLISDQIYFNVGCEANRQLWSYQWSSVSIIRLLSQFK